MKLRAHGLLLTFCLAGCLIAVTGLSAEDIGRPAVSTPSEFRLPETMFSGRESRAADAPTLHGSIADKPLVRQLPTSGEHDGLFAVGGLMVLALALVLGAGWLAQQTAPRRPGVSDDE